MLSDKFKLLYFRFLKPNRYTFYGFDIDATVDQLNEVDDYIEAYKTDLLKKHNPFANARPQGWRNKK